MNQTELLSWLRIFFARKCTLGLDGKSGNEEAMLTMIATVAIEWDDPEDLLNVLARVCAEAIEQIQAEKELDGVRIAH